MIDLLKLDAASKIMRPGDEWRSENFMAIMAKDRTLMTCQGAKLRIDSAILSEKGKVTHIEQDSPN